MRSSRISKIPISVPSYQYTNDEQKFLYCGSSMRFVFKQGQVLYIRPNSHDFNPGDIIVFKEHALSQNIVHRIISRSENGYLTRGENNKFCDPYLVRKEWVIGKVEKFARRGNLEHVIGGWQGLWISRARRVLLYLDSWFRKTFITPYSVIRSRKILSHVWRPEITKVCFRIGNRTLIKYLHRQVTVAVYNPAEHTFICRKPFDLVIPSPLDH